MKVFIKNLIKNEKIGNYSSFFSYWDTIMGTYKEEGHSFYEVRNNRMK